MARLLSMQPLLFPRQGILLDKKMGFSSLHIPRVVVEGVKAHVLLNNNYLLFANFDFNLICFILLSNLRKPSSAPSFTLHFLFLHKQSYFFVDDHSWAVASCGWR
jgi:hypothetical protein